MPKYDQNSGQKALLLAQRGEVREHFVTINHDWLIPVQSLRKLINGGTVDSVIFPSEEPFDSHWQLYIEHQTQPGRLRIGLALLAPRDRCFRADIKVVLMATHGEQIIKEHLFHNHTFFLSKGEAICSYINEHISPKICLDLTEEIYQTVINGDKYLNTDDCTIIIEMKFMNEYDVEPKIKTLDFSRQFTVDWKLTKFRSILEQIDQSRPPAENNRRLVSDRFQFTHVKMLEGLSARKWKLIIQYPRTSPNSKQTPLSLALQCSNHSQPNYGKVEIICQNEHNVLRRYNDSIEDLTENYSVEFFTLDELSANIYKYKENVNETNGRSESIEYLLISIRIVQPYRPSKKSKQVQPLPEPTVISLNNAGNVRQKKSVKEKRTKSVGTKKKEVESPRKTASQDEKRSPNPVLPPIRNRNPSPVRLRSPSFIEKLPRPAISKPNSIPKQPSTVPSASTSNSHDQTDNFTFLANLFRSGLHSDITIFYQDHQWNLHKSILSTRSIYFNQYFATSKASELVLSEDRDELPPFILERMFLYLYTNQYTPDKYTPLLLQSSMKYGVDSLTQLCLQELFVPSNLTIHNAANLLILLHQTMTDSYAKYHSKEYLDQVKSCKQIVLRFIHAHGREVLISPQWKFLERQYPILVHNVLEFMVFEKLEE